MNVKLIPNNDLKEILKEYFEGREILYVIARENKMDAYKRAERLKKSTKSRVKPIVCTVTNHVYPSIRAAAKELHLDAGAISKVLHGKQESTKGHKFKYQ